MNRLQYWRTTKGLSVRELAAQSGVSASTISKMENGHHKAFRITLVKLARVLDAPLADLEEELLDVGAAERGRRGGTTTAQRSRSQASSDDAPLPASQSAPSEAGSADNPAPLAP